MEVAQPTSPAVDPVCGMPVEPGRAVGPSEYGGDQYFFCSDACRRRFEADPAQYAPGQGSMRIPIT